MIGQLVSRLVSGTINVIQNVIGYFKKEAQDEAKQETKQDTKQETKQEAKPNNKPPPRKKKKKRKKKKALIFTQAAANGGAEEISAPLPMPRYRTDPDWTSAFQTILSSIRNNQKETAIDILLESAKEQFLEKRAGFSKQDLDNYWQDIQTIKRNNVRVRELESAVQDEMEQHKPQPQCPTPAWKDQYRTLLLAVKNPAAFRIHADCQLQCWHDNYSNHMSDNEKECYLEDLNHVILAASKSGIKLKASDSIIKLKGAVCKSKYLHCREDQWVGKPIASIRIQGTSEQGRCYKSTLGDLATAIMNVGVGHLYLKGSQALSPNHPHHDADLLMVLNERKKTKDIIRKLITAGFTIHFNHRLYQDKSEIAQLFNASYSHPLPNFKVSQSGCEIDLQLSFPISLGEDDPCVLERFIYQSAVTTRHAYVRELLLNVGRKKKAVATMGRLVTSKALMNDFDIANPVWKILIAPSAAIPRPLSPDLPDSTINADARMLLKYNKIEVRLFLLLLKEWRRVITLAPEIHIDTTIFIAIWGIASKYDAIMTAWRQRTTPGMPSTFGHSNELPAATNLEQTLFDPVKRFLIENRMYPSAQKEKSLPLCEVLNRFKIPDARECSPTKP